MRQRPAHHEARGAAAAAPAGRAWAAEWLDARFDTVEEHLALDEALLEEAHEGLATGAVVRTWMADTPAVVVGSSSRLDEEIDREACAALGVRVCRRPSGGLTVVLGPGCLMWSVIVPHPEAAPPIEQIHAGMLGPLQQALCAAGLAVDRRGSSDLVLIQGDDAAALKFSGNALRVRRHGVLYHGTLLDNFDISLISRVLRHPPREPDYRACRPHGEFLANLHLGRSVLESLVRQAFGAVATRDTIPHDRVERLVRERYAREDWTNRL
ncbi:MAG: lipoate--protein ligase family protein [Planctomycetota bacterium]